MFNGCKNLNYVNVGFTYWEVSTDYWLESVSPTGTFECPSGLPSERGTSYIPEGWNIIKY
jgi:hypothetical protein